MLENPWLEISDVTWFLANEVPQTLTNSSVGASFTFKQYTHTQKESETLSKVITVYAQQKALHIHLSQPHTQSCIQTSNHPVISLALYPSRLPLPPHWHQQSGKWESPLILTFASLWWRCPAGLYRQIKRQPPSATANDYPRVSVCWAHRCKHWWSL